MALLGISQYNHNQQIDEYEYDDTDNFYDDGGNYGSYLEVDDSEGKTNYIDKFRASIELRLIYVQIRKRPANLSTGMPDEIKMNHWRLKNCKYPRPKCSVEWNESASN